MLFRGRKISGGEGIVFFFLNILTESRFIFSTARIEVRKVKSLVGQLLGCVSLKFSLLLLVLYMWKVEELIGGGGRE